MPDYKFIDKNFVSCFKPYNYDLSPDEFVNSSEIPNSIISSVKLSEIKTVHSFRWDDLINDCYFYTYKNEWYITHISRLKLVSVINNNLKKINSIE